MTILIDIRPLMDKQYSGVSEYVYRLLEAIFAIDKTNNYILFCNAAHAVGERLPKFNQDNVKVVIRHIPNKIFNYAMLWPFNRPRFDKLVGVKVDIFFMPHLHFAAWSKNIDSILTVHDLSFLINRKWFSFHKNIWHWFINVKRLAKKFKIIVAVSENTKSDLMALANIKEDKIKVIYSGIDENFRPIDSQNEKLQQIKQKYNLTKPFILFLATIEPRKNIIGLVQAWEILKQKTQFKDLQLVIAGGQGWKAKPIIKRIKISAYQEDIILLNYVPVEEKPYLYNLAKVFAYPSFYEGFGFPPLEALACGIPVVASANTSLTEIIDQAGVLVDPYSPTSLALALEQVLVDNDLVINLRARGLEQVKKFSWDKIAQEYLRLFEQYGRH